jgi:hypothetical protein
MKLTGNTHSDNEARVDLSARAERDPLSANAELSGRALFANTSYEDENAVNLVDLNGQDPRRPTRLVETKGLRINSLATPNSPFLNGETSTSRHLTQNDIVVLAGERGTWQWSLRSTGVRRTFAAEKDLTHELLLPSLRILRSSDAPTVQGAAIDCGVD